MSDSLLQHTNSSLLERQTAEAGKYAQAGGQTDRHRQTDRNRDRQRSGKIFNRARVPVNVFIHNGTYFNTGIMLPPLLPFHLISSAPCDVSFLCGVFYTKINIPVYQTAWMSRAERHRRVVVGEFQLNGRRVSFLVAATNHFTVSSLASYLHCVRLTVSVCWGVSHPCWGTA